MQDIDKDALDRQIQEAMGAHAALKRRLRAAAASGRLTHPSHAISTEHGCKFGHWLFHLKSVAPIARSPHYRAVVTAHAGFHRQAGRVARLIEDGQRDLAEAALNAIGFRKAASLLMSEMMAWRRSI